MHVLEAGYESAERPCLLLLHGFPELAYSWRKIMIPLAAAGYHVLAPDQRGYGRTTGWTEGYSDDLAEFGVLNLVKDAVGLVEAAGHRQVAAVIGHDCGSPVAAWCAMTRPDVFQSLVLMSAPFGGLRPQVSSTEEWSSINEVRKIARGAIASVLRELSRLDPPRKHYQWYYSTREAAFDMLNAPQGLHAFLRGYFHIKSADWDKNHPYPLASFSASELAKLPAYYVMREDETMAQVVMRLAPEVHEMAGCEWLSDDELRIYVQEYSRTGFQGGLQWYRCATDSKYVARLSAWIDHTVNVPSIFIAGEQDWGIYQKPSEFEAMPGCACTRMLNVHLVEGAGHWVQQEKPDAVVRLLISFLETVCINSN
ncbi:Hydrolase, HAD superfamily [Paraburkholderia caribensis MBA4]|uniref:Hydrolase, HAD superfamily n=2 Tax=Paraburkholderia caribensis TaxID=75105 RepID=A0A0P0RIS8_9BURK|nr:Hydrolase, HAD superfamily [Paraburkholderia caribensis MBA4]